MEEISYFMRGSCGNISAGLIAVTARVARHNPNTKEPTQETS